LFQQWRRRYFVLYAPPPSATNSFGQCLALFDYFDNEQKTRKKGSIDLTHCEEVLLNMESPQYHHVFGLQTKKDGRDRKYYLAADSEEAMNKWVEILCRVLHLDTHSKLCAVCFADRNTEDTDAF